MAAVDEPVTYQEAMDSTGRGDWNCTMKEDLDCNEENSTWRVSRLPIAKEEIPCKIAFNHIFDVQGHVDRYNDRLLAKCYVQKHSINYDNSLHWLFPLICCFH